MSSQTPVFAAHHNTPELHQNLKHDRDLPASSCSRFVTSYHLISHRHVNVRSTRGTVATQASSAMGHETPFSDHSVRCRTSFPRAPPPYCQSQPLIGWRPSAGRHHFAAQLHREPPPTREKRTAADGTSFDGCHNLWSFTPPPRVPRSLDPMSVGLRSTECCTAPYASTCRPSSASLSSVTSNAASLYSSNVSFNASAAAVYLRTGLRASDAPAAVPTAWWPFRARGAASARAAGDVA